MALTVLSRNYGTLGNKRTQFGMIAFTTTSKTGELDTVFKGISSAQLTINGSPATKTDSISTGDLGTVNATYTVSVVVPRAGTVSGASFLVTTTVATHNDNHWHVGIVNKGPAGAGTAVVVDSANEANGNDANSTPAGAAFTAYTPRALTLTSTAADLAVAANDILEITFTKAASGADLVDLVATIVVDTGEVDETVYVDESGTTANGRIAVPSTGTITIARKSNNPTSGLTVSYLLVSA